MTPHRPSRLIENGFGHKAYEVGEYFHCKCGFSAPVYFSEPVIGQVMHDCKLNKNVDDLNKTRGR